MIKLKKILKRILVGLVFLCMVCLVGGYIYVNDYYHADTEAVSAIYDNIDIVVKETDDYFSFEVKNPKAGFIFYPGGKVETEAYMPLMNELAKHDILCILAKMPFRLAVLDIAAASSIKEDFKDISSWYIGGHSLGGAMASNYLEKHSEEYNGLILLGAYSANDLSQTSLNVLSIYGSEDQVLNKEKYQENIKNLPASFKEYVIKGGCHSYFGYYGHQDGDGNPSITREEQIIQTSKYISDFIQ